VILKESDRYHFIDALRGIAVLLVLVIHISEVYVKISSNGRHSGAWIAAISHEFDFGRKGVTVFFIISGFVIPSSLSGTKINGSIKFLISRFFRLFPLFWISVFLSLVTQDWTAGKYPGWNDVALNLTMMPEFFGVTPINGAYWTLAVELVFYFSCLILFLTFGIRNLNVISLLTVGLTFTFFEREYVREVELLQSRFGDYPMLLGFMFWGALARVRFEAGKLPKIGEFSYWLIALWWLVGYPLAGFHEAYVRTHAEADLVPRMYGSYFCAFAIFFFSVHFFRLKNEYVCKIGRISYSVYLLHGPVIFSGIFLIDHYFPDIKGRVSLYAWLLLILGATFWLANFAYHRIELPFQEVGKLIGRRISNITRTPSTVEASMDKSNRTSEFVSRQR